MTHTNILKELLDKQDYLLADGAMGTTLMEMGVEHGDPPEEWNVIHPESIALIHRNYIEAGSQIILTNSFGGTRFRLNLHNLQDRVTEFNKAAAAIAREEADKASSNVIVAGSMGPSGELIEPLGLLTPAEIADGFAEQAEALAEGGADILWIETMSDLKEVESAIEGARQVTNLPIVTTMTFDTHGHTMMGVSPEQKDRGIQDLHEWGVVFGAC